MTAWIPRILEGLLLFATLFFTFGYIRTTYIKVEWVPGGSLILAAGWTILAVINGWI